LGGLFDIEIKKKRLQEISNLEADPSFWEDSTAATKIQKEKKLHDTLIGQFDGAVSHLDDMAVLVEFSEEEGSVSDENYTEMKTAFQAAETVLRKLELSKMLSGELDSGNAILAINAGAGGTEACDWAGILARMYQRYANAQGFKCETIDFTDGDGAGYRSISFEISGDFAYGYLKAEAGVHRLVRISPFDANKKRHTSFASVFAYPMTDEDIEVDLNMEDVRVDTYRASGSGGQKVNKTDSAVRMTHGPSGIVVQCQAERSQIQNKTRAIKMLKARLYELEIERRQSEQDKVHDKKKTIEWGSQIRNYVLQPYQLIKDVRTGHENSNVSKVLDGDLQSFIESYLIQAADV